MKILIRYCSVSIVLFCALCFFAGDLSAQTRAWENPVNPVSDFANVISDVNENRINLLAQKVEEVTKDELAIVTITSYEERGFGSIEETAVDLFEKWGIGKQGEDNGLLVLVAVNERNWRIEVGYGLEGMIPDAVASNLGRTILPSYFRAGNYSEGLESLSIALVQRIAEQRNIPLSQFQITERPQQPQSSNQQKTQSIFSSIGSILFGLFMLYMFIKHPRLLILLMMMNSGNRRSNWGGGSGFGGGIGGGGFGGFGGGMSGGGGASGGW